jgi:hypothetical protein
MNSLLNELADLCRNRFTPTQIADIIRREHRTNQQTLVREILIPTIRAMAEQGTDPRNEASVNLCKKLLAVIEEDGAALPYI